MADKIIINNNLYKRRKKNKKKGSLNPYKFCEEWWKDTPLIFFMIFLFLIFVLG